MRKRRHVIRLSLLVALASLLVIAAPTMAQQRCEAPPGTAAIDQYCETVPSAGGEREARRPNTPTTDPSRPSASGLDAATARALRAQGPDGRALAEQLEANRSGPSSASEAEAADGVAEPVAENSESPTSAVRSAVADGATAGTTLPWALLAVTVLMLGLTWMRLRRSRPESLD